MTSTPSGTLTDGQAGQAQGAEHGHEHGTDQGNEHGHDRDHATDGELAVTVERRPGSQVALTVEAAAADVDAAVTHAIRHLGSRYRFPGFRPGKAPAAIIERAAGWPAIAQEAVETLVPNVYRRALEQAGVMAVSDPELDVSAALERGAPYRFTAVVTVKPEVDLGGYAGLRVEEAHTVIDDARVDEAIESVRRQHAELVDADRPAQAGDVLRASLVMRRGEQIMGAEGEERDVELDRDQLIPGLADALIGLSAGQSHIVELTLPDTYANEELRGVTVTVDATVNAVRERRLPPLDDALAALDGHGETLDELRTWYRERLTGLAEREDAQHFEGEVLDRLVEGARVEIPAVMVEREVERGLREMELRLAGSGLRLDRYLQYTGETLDQVRAARRPAAEKRVRLELVLEALAEAESIEIDESDVEREERAVVADRKVNAEQRRRVHMATHRDLLMRAAGQRALEIARGQ